MAHKIILDTDPGIDDAMAIFFAFQSPDIDVLGEKDSLDDIVAVFKEQWSECEVIITLGKAGVMMLKNNDCIKVEAILLIRS